MANRIVRTEMMNPQAVQQGFVLQEISNARAATAHFQFQFVMESMIVATVLMRKIVNMIVQSMNLNAYRMAAAFWMLGSVMVTRIVLMVQMKMMLFAIINLATRRLNFHATMANVFRYCGGVTLTMIAEMTVMSQHIFAGTRIVQQDGNVAQVMPTTDASQSGCSVTAKMTAGMALTNYLKTVQPVRKRVTSSVKTRDVFQDVGFVTFPMIVVIILMSLKRCVQADTVSAQNQSSNVEMENAYPDVGDVTWMMIVETIRTNWVVSVIPVLMIGSNVIPDIVSRLNLNVMAKEIALISPMKDHVHPDTLEDVIVQRTVLSAETTFV